MGAGTTGVLLVNLGTPDSPAVSDVRRYLREFLSDPLVLDLPLPARWLLLHAVILPLRPRRSAHAYRQIWTDAGSPLLVHSRALRDRVAAALGEGFCVELAMRYGQPSIPDAVERLARAGVARVVVLPLFPQFSSAASGSAAACAQQALARRIPEVPREIRGAFHDHPGFLAAWRDVAAPRLAAFRPDHVIFSYHGLPVRQVRRADPSGEHCLASEACCDVLCAINRDCYRAQCFATTRALAATLQLEPEAHSLAFQSRLGGDRWIRPHTDRVLPELARRDVKRLAVLCPAFVADCLETLEEIGIRARAQWESLGGEALLLVPSLNAAGPWVEAVADLVRRPHSRVEAVGDADAV